MEFSAENCIDQMGEGHLPLHDPHEGERRKKRHDALGVIENTGRLVDQHEAQRDQRIKNASHEPVYDHFDAIKKFR